MLDKFLKAKEQEILRLQQNRTPEHHLKRFRDSRPGFSRALLSESPGAIIAEYKRASPSRGEINLCLSPAEVGSMYQQGGASAISVLTEEKYFKSKLDYLFDFQESGLPLLRKDFIFDRLQIQETATTPASALLLITRLFNQADALADCVDYTQELGMEPVVEVFDHQDLDMARKSGARIIQVNNRDLQTLEVDPNISRTLIHDKDNAETWICASGLNNAEEKEVMGSLGYDACLIGTSIMASEDPVQKLREFTGNSYKL